MNYPEHEKLKKVKHFTQAIHDFLEFLEGKGIYLEHRERGRVGHRNELAEFYNIDQDRLEREKVAMLDECRRLNAKEQK